MMLKIGFQFSDGIMVLLICRIHATPSDFTWLQNALAATVSSPPEIFTLQPAGLMG
jgi:hypothetical protein